MQRVDILSAAQAMSWPSEGRGRNSEQELGPALTGCRTSGLVAARDLKVLTTGGIV